MLFYDEIKLFYQKIDFKKNYEKHLNLLTINLSLNNMSEIKIFQINDIQSQNQLRLRNFAKTKMSMFLLQNKLI